MITRIFDNMFVEKLIHSLFADQALPDNLTELSSYPINNIILFTEQQVSLLESKGIETISDLAESWSKLSDIASDNGILPLEILERASAGVRILLQQHKILSGSTQDVSDSIKFVLVGLDRAGKSSILSMLKRGKPLLEIRLLINKLMPTAGESTERLTIAGLPIHMHELGGHEEYRATYLEKPEEFFLNSQGLIFVVDLQDSSRYETAKNYLKKIKDLLTFLGIPLPIYAFLHKNDPPISKNIENAITILKKDLEPITNFIFVTSIYEPATIANAFTLIVQNSLPVTHWLNEGLTRLSIEELKTPYLSIIDKGVILGEYSAFMYSTTESIREKIQNQLYQINPTKPYYVVVEKQNIDPKRPLFLVITDIIVNNLPLTFAAVVVAKAEALHLDRETLSVSISNRVGVEIKFLTITKTALSQNPNFTTKLHATTPEWRNQD